MDLFNTKNLMLFDKYEQNSSPVYDTLILILFVALKLTELTEYFHNVLIGYSTIHGLTGPIYGH